MNLLERARGRVGRRQIESLEDYALALSSFTYGGLSYGPLMGGMGITQTLAGGQMTELAPNNFIGLSMFAYQSNGPVFACMLVRQLVFSSIRFQWQQLRGGKPSEMFGNGDLAVLEEPWPGGTTQDLLGRMINDADLAGNSYWYKNTSLARLGTQSPGSELVRMRPDWTNIVCSQRMLERGPMLDNGRQQLGQLGWKKEGYVYSENGDHSSPVAFMADEVVHFAPIPDPMATYRGMSWLTPILREIQADQAMTRHQRAFFDNGATVNMVVKHPDGASQEKVQTWIKEFKEKHGGVENAYKTLNLYPGADAVAVGSNMKEIDFKSVRGGGETRIAAAAGVPPVIVGLSEGLAAATYSNYGQARRRLADGTAHPLWQNMAASMQTIVKPPRTGVRLWYDARDVPFLREDEKDAASIQQVRAATIASLIASGFTPESAVAAVESNDFLGQLKHTGLTSVQLQPPGDEPAPAEEKPPGPPPSNTGDSEDDDNEDD